MTPTDHNYTTRQVAKLLNWPERHILMLVREGVVDPARDGSGYRFDFRHLVVIRSAMELSQAGVSLVRIRRSLRELAEAMPDDADLAARRVRPRGPAVVMEADGVSWEVDTGQGTLPLAHEDHTKSPSGKAPTLFAGNKLTVAERALELVLEAIALEDEGDWTGASAVYEDALRTDPACFDALINLARLQQVAGDLDRAAALNRRALAEEPDSPLAWFNLGTVQEDQKQHEAAIASYENAARLGEQDAHLNAARLLERCGQRERALQHMLRFQQAVR